MPTATPGSPQTISLGANDALVISCAAVDAVASVAGSTGFIGAPYELGRVVGEQGKRFGPYGRAVTLIVSSLSGSIQADTVQPKRAGDGGEIFGAAKAAALDSLVSKDGIPGAADSAAVAGLLRRGVIGGYPPVGVLSRSAVAAPFTGSTTATKVVSLWLPKGTLGPNGAWRLTLWTSETNNANAKTLIVRLNSTPIYQANLSSLAGRRLQFEGWNRGATGSQLNFATSVATPLGGFGQPWIATSFDTANNDTEIQVVVQLANAADIFTVEASLLEILPD